jgi:hypothetical protein
MADLDEIIAKLPVKLPPRRTSRFRKRFPTAKSRILLFKVASILFPLIVTLAFTVTATLIDDEVIRRVSLGLVVGLSTVLMFVPVVYLYGNNWGWWTDDDDN